MERCVKCSKAVCSVNMLITAYGEIRCEDCWDDYLMTDKGKVEYFIGIIRGDYPMDYFDADFLGHVVVCWKKYRDELNLTVKEIRELEAKAELIGLL